MMMMYQTLTVTGRVERKAIWKGKRFEERETFWGKGNVLREEGNVLREDSRTYSLIINGRETGFGLTDHFQALIPVSNKFFTFFHSLDNLRWTNKPRESGREERLTKKNFPLVCFYYWQGFFLHSSLFSSFFPFLFILPFFFMSNHHIFINCGKRKSKDFYTQMKMWDEGKWRGEGIFRGLNLNWCHMLFLVLSLLLSFSLSYVLFCSFLCHITVGA